MSKSVFVLLFLLNYGFISEGYGLNDDQLQVPQGELHEIENADLAPSELSSSFFNELWTYQIYLDDDIHLYIVFTQAAFGRFRSPVTGARMSVLGFAGDNYQVAREFSRNMFTYHSENNYLRLHPGREIWFRGRLDGEHIIKYNTSKDGVDYDVEITLSEIQQGYRLNDGVFELKGDKIGIQVPIPKARAEGYISINGNRKEVTGTAYMDKTFQTNISPRILKTGFRYISHDGENWETGIYLLQKAESTRQVLGYGLRKSDDGSVELLQPSSIEIGPRNPVHNSQIIQWFSLAVDGRRDRRIIRTRDREKSPLLNELSGFQYSIAKAFMGGEMVEFRGDAEINGVKGFYNFFIVE